MRFIHLLKKMFIIFNSYIHFFVRFDDSTISLKSDKSLLGTCVGFGIRVLSLHNVNVLLLTRCNHIDTRAKTVFALLIFICVSCADASFVEFVHPIALVAYIFKKRYN